MAYLGEDEWESPQPRRPSPRNLHEFHRSSQFLNPQGNFTGLHRTRSQGHAPVPVVNVFNDVHQATDYRKGSNSPPYTAHQQVPYPPSPSQQVPYPTSPEFHGRGRRSNSRLREHLREQLLAEELAGLGLDRQRRSRSRGRTDADILDRNRDYYQWQAEQARSELREMERQKDREREEERIKQELELQRIKSEAKRKADEEQAEADRKRMIEEYERGKVEKAERARQAEADLLAKIQREEKEKQEREEREYAEFLAKQKEKKERAEREAKEKKAEIDDAMRRRFKKLGYRDDQIETMLSDDYNKKVTPKQTTTTTTTTTLEKWKSPRQPVYAKVHRNYLSIETLVYYDIPYEYDCTDPNYIIILREMDKYETDVLFEHTRRLRSGKLLLEAPKNEKQYAWYRTRSRSRSKNGKGQIERFGILELKK